jgi:2,4-dienoyl-CoA reductase (NADPH2)
MKQEFVSNVEILKIITSLCCAHKFSTHHPSIAVATIATSVPRGAFSFVTKKLRDEKILSIPLCATNRINAPSTVESILASGSADLISMARPFLADPDIVKKSREGRAEDINTCIACNQACLDHAFIGKTASCLVNPR